MGYQLLMGSNGAQPELVLEGHRNKEPQKLPKNSELTLSVQKFMEVSEHNSDFFNFKGILTEASKALKYDIKPNLNQHMYSVQNDDFLKLFESREEDSELISQNESVD